jgi:hypothetical protein
MALWLQYHRSKGEKEEENHQHDGEVEQGPLCTTAGLVDAAVASPKDASQALPFDLEENSRDKTYGDYDLHNLQVKNQLDTS